MYLRSMQPPPSPTAKSDDYITIQAGDQKILDCRYVSESYETVAPPIQLLNPAFAYFTSKAFDPEHDVPPAFICRVRDVVESFAFVHPSESYRRGHLTSIIQDIVGCPTSLVGNVDGTSSDGVVVHTDERIVRYPVIHEEQRELGGGQLDPSTQGTLSYPRIFRQRCPQRKPFMISGRRHTTERYHMFFLCSRERGSS